ncbi:MAG: hypothetical protein MJ156_02035 [Alphaproteobacteria bacterium]|nr:hypothetical protein [Alphaproteobacteria bacterium]
MKNKLLVLSIAVASMLSSGAYADGTYYNGNMYSSPQHRNSRYASSQQSYSSRYGRNNVAGQNVKTIKKQTRTDSESSVRDNKRFSFDLGFNHEFANWKFDMNEAGSILHYDNLRWNVLDAKFAYNFTNSLRLNVGGRYGWQFGETSMIDDDITNGGMWDLEPGDISYDFGDGVQAAGTVSHALSRGTSKDGTQFGFNADLGYSFGNKLKITPAVGYRYFKYKLSTEKNYGVLLDTVANENGDSVGVVDGTQVLYPSAEMLVGNQLGVDLYSVYYEQADKTHEYNVLWHGPYVAMDVDYLINNNNSVNLRAELGLPLYKSEADQPYRTDLAHSKSFEDNGDFGKAIHFGLGANWLTALTDSLSLSVGLTYDYYKVNDATAKTYLNENRYNELLRAYNTEGYTEEQMLLDNPEAYSLALSYEACNGWTCEVKNEINSIYKSMGIRVGLEAKF